MTAAEAEKYVKLKKRISASEGRAAPEEMPTAKQIADGRKVEDLVEIWFVFVCVEVVFAKVEQRQRVAREFFHSVMEREDGGYLHQVADEELEVRLFVGFSILCCVFFFLCFCFGGAGVSGFGAALFWGVGLSDVGGGAEAAAERDDGVGGRRDVDGRGSGGVVQHSGDTDGEDME